MKIKTIIYTLALILGSNVLFANNGEPTDKKTVVLYADETMEFSMNASENPALITTIHYDNETGFFNLELNADVEFVSVKDLDGNQVFKMPLGSKKIHFDLDIFSEGIYSMNLNVNGIDSAVKTSLIKK